MTAACYHRVFEKPQIMDELVVSNQLNQSNLMLTLSIWLAYDANINDSKSLNLMFF